MKYFSMFSGIGGFELGIQYAFQNLSDAEKQQHEATDTKHPKRRLDTDGKERLGNLACVGYSEIDKYAVQIYQKHFPDHKNYGDATKINPAELSDFDLLVGGFPCQAFSIAGKRLGFGDTGGNLFFEIARILASKQPRLLLLENVKGLLSHNDGRTFKTIITTLAELGYCVEWQVLNSKNFGVPQNRERVFIVGHLGGIPRQKVFPIGESEQKSGTALGLQGFRQIAGTLRATDYKGTHNNIREFYANLQETQAQQAWAIRRLTPLEAERLQGFPDGWTEGISDTQRYKCLGNAVTVNVIQAVVERMF